MVSSPANAPKKPESKAIIRSRMSRFSISLRNTLKSERMMALLSGFFGALAGLLTMIGLYGVISYIVVTRKKDRKSTRLNSSHVSISYAVFCLKKKKKKKLNKTIYK